MRGRNLATVNVRTLKGFFPGSEPSVMIQSVAFSLATVLCAFADDTCFSLSRLTLSHRVEKIKWLKLHKCREVGFTIFQVFRSLPTSLFPCVSTPVLVLSVPRSSLNSEMETLL